MLIMPKAWSVWDTNAFLVYASEGRDPVAYMDPFQGVYQCSQMGIDNTGQTFTALTNRIKPDIVFVHKVNALPPDFDRRMAYRKIRMVHDHDLWCPKGQVITPLAVEPARLKPALPAMLMWLFCNANVSGLFPVSSGVSTQS